MSRLIDADAFWKHFEEGKTKLLLIKSMLPPEIIDATLKIYAEIKEMIDSMPTIEPEPHWIPCTPETMPEEYSEFLCCDAYGEQIIGMPYVDDDSNTGYSAESEAMYMVDCIAWQPLPEPYQPEEK